MDAVVGVTGVALRSRRGAVLEVASRQRSAPGVSQVVDVRLHHQVAAAAELILLRVLEDGEVAHGEQHERKDAEGEKVDPERAALRLAAPIDDERRRDAEEDRARDDDRQHERPVERASPLEGGWLDRTRLWCARLRWYRLEVPAQALHMGDEAPDLRFGQRREVGHRRRL